MPGGGAGFSRSPSDWPKPGVFSPGGHWTAIHAQLTPSLHRMLARSPVSRDLLDSGRTTANCEKLRRARVLGA